MIKFFPSEEFKEVQLEGQLQKRYAISNYGRFVSFTDSIEKGRILKGSKTEGFRLHRYKIKEKGVVKHKHRFYGKMVAEYFVPKNSEAQTQVIHLDYNLENDYFENLKWVTKEEMYEHNNKNPKFIENIEKLKKFTQTERLKMDGHKLSVTDVIRIKKRLADPKNKTRMKLLAKQFNISTMQLYRIKTGENWGHIKI